MHILLPPLTPSPVPATLQEHRGYLFNEQMKVKMVNECLALCKELWRFKDRDDLEAVKYPTQNSNIKCKTTCDHQKAAGSVPGSEQGSRT